MSGTQNIILEKLIVKLRDIQDRFEKEFGIKDIYTNSKFAEIMIANNLNHKLIPGHAGSRDGKDDKGEYEYKHFKESSSNHSWTFNDFSDATIEKLKSCHQVIFAHISDTEEKVEFDWYYSVPGNILSVYLAERIKSIKNNRKMINVSGVQIEKDLGIKKSYSKDFIKSNNSYAKYIEEIFETAMQIEEITGTKNVLTSNKLWEILVSIYTSHKILSDQKKHDAIDAEGRYYEYKVSVSGSWSFEDISESVLNKFMEEKGIILALVDKAKLAVLEIYFAEPEKVVKRLREKLKLKEERYRLKGKTVRRIQESLRMKDLSLIEAHQIYPH